MKQIIFLFMFIMALQSATANNVTNASPILGNANFTATAGGILRSGIFATATSNRITSGASFYGVMELSGSLTEATVTIGNLQGRSYNDASFLNAVFGNGSLSINGNANAYSWP